MITCPVSVGELIDRLTILKIKSERIKDTKKLNHIHKELHELTAIAEEHILAVPNLMEELKTVNSELWNLEDKIREKEKYGEFNEEFIKIARSIYITNDRRFALKKKINEISGSTFQEQKSHKEY